MIERESEAWRVLAEAYALAAPETGYDFLCWWLEVAPGKERTIAWVIPEAAQFFAQVSRVVRARMYARVCVDLVYPTSPAYGDANGFGDLDMTHEDKHNARVLACLMFAEEAESEGR